MSNGPRHLVLALCASLVGMLLVVHNGLPAEQLPQVMPQTTATPTATPAPRSYLPQIMQPAIPPHLELSVDAASVHVGDIITLHVAYIYIGLQVTTIGIAPPTLVQFDPARVQPCHYGSDPTQCTVFTFRAIAPGTVTFTASATGEIYDPICRCYLMSGASDNGAVSVAISAPAPHKSHHAAARGPAGRTPGDGYQD